MRLRTASASSLLLYGPRDLRWLPEDLPPVRAGMVRLTTLAGGISVGTELPLYRGDAREAAPRLYPLMTGYESLARVVEVGDRVEGLEPGQRVVATYGHRTAASVRADHVIPVPDDIPDEIALLSILSNDAGKGTGKLKLQPDSPVLVSGAGTIGLLALHRLRWLGIQHVDVVEPLPARRALALTFGARTVYAPDAFPADAIYAAGVECSSTQAGFALLQRSVKPNGQLCLLSDGNLEPLVLIPEFHSRELSVVASSDGEDYPGYARALFDYWRKTKGPLERLFDWRVSASELPQTFERMLVERPLKVFVSYP